jgi:hypothetical protein
MRFFTVDGGGGPAGRRTARPEPVAGRLIPAQRRATDPGRLQLDDATFDRF